MNVIITTFKQSYFLKNIDGCIPVCIHLHPFCRSTFLKFKYLIEKGMRLMRIFFSLDI